MLDKGVWWHATFLKEKGKTPRALRSDTNSYRNGDPDEQFSEQIVALLSLYTQPANGPA